MFPRPPSFLLEVISHVHLPGQPVRKGHAVAVELRDIGIIGVGLLLSVLALTQTGIALPLVLTAVFAFLTIRHEGTSILDFIRYAAAFLITKQQYYEWRLDP